MWGSQERIFGQKVNENFFSVDQGKEKPKNVKKYYFPGSFFLAILLNEFDF